MGGYFQLGNQIPKPLPTQLPHLSEKETWTEGISHPDMLAHETRYNYK